VRTRERRDLSWNERRDKIEIPFSGGDVILIARRIKRNRIKNNSPTFATWAKKNFKLFLIFLIERKKKQNVFRNFYISYESGFKFFISLSRYLASPTFVIPNAFSMNTSWWCQGSFARKIKRKFLRQYNPLNTRNRGGWGWHEGERRKGYLEGWSSLPRDGARCASSSKNMDFMHE